MRWVRGCPGVLACLAIFGSPSVLLDSPLSLSSFLAIATFSPVRNATFRSLSLYRFFLLFYFFFAFPFGSKSLLNYYCNYRWVSPGNIAASCQHHHHHHHLQLYIPPFPHLVFFSRSCCDTADDCVDPTIMILLRFRVVVLCFLNFTGNWQLLCSPHRSCGVSYGTRFGCLPKTVVLLIFLFSLFFIHNQI